MYFLRRRDGGDAWWAAVEGYRSSAPGLVRSLMGGPSVVCDRPEARQALAWAKRTRLGARTIQRLEIVDTIAGVALIKDTTKLVSRAREVCDDCRRPARP